MKGNGYKAAIPIVSGIAYVRNPRIGPRPAHRVFTDSPQFKRWFGKSVLVRDDGDPVVLFHGTSSDFYVFEKTGKTSLRPFGFWFSDDPATVEVFGDLSLIHI